MHINLDTSDSGGQLTSGHPARLRVPLAVSLLAVLAVLLLSHYPLIGQPSQHDKNSQPVYFTDLEMLGASQGYWPESLRRSDWPALETAHWKTYTSPGGDYSFVYPPEWETDEIAYERLGTTSRALRYRDDVCNDRINCRLLIINRHSAPEEDILEVVRRGERPKAEHWLKDRQLYLQHGRLLDFWIRVGSRLYHISGSFITSLPEPSEDTPALGEEIGAILKSMTFW